VVSALAARGLAHPDVVRPGRADRSHVDLAGALRRALVDCGVPASAIETSPHCTWQDGDACFSHRRDGPRTGRHALVAGFLR
jgi:copper oxidase (laccase) domain-containing protein